MNASCYGYCMFALSRVFLLVPLLLGVASGKGWHINDHASLQVSDSQGSKKHGKHAKRIEVEHLLIICNAYVSPAALEVYHVQILESLTGSSPLNYKECRSFFIDIADGDQLDFRVGNLDVGTFYATGTPKASSVLLLVPHRLSSNSMALSFESHVFADSLNPQIAVVDAYTGSSNSVVKVWDATPVPAEEADAAQEPAETLQFNSVVAVHVGNYQVSLVGSGERSNITEVSTIKVQDQGRYVILRAGNEANATIGGQAYPEELVVFPSSRASGMNLGWGLVSLIGLVALCLN
mmetsp:Transcript_94535/g.148842  ORF Transcript_94535/g.148842 Transcript_94535/m.148842 type:complete len:293 (-) Transcript_94535:21-899(-)